MLMNTTTNFTELFAAWSKGDQNAGDMLYAGAYDELKNIARHTLGSFGRGDQLHTTMLVNECYLKVAASESLMSENRQHFLALCARAMRQIIVDSARRQLAGKRGAGDICSVILSESMEDLTLGPDAIAALDQALTALDQRDPRLARIAECRIFSDMSTSEIAVTFGVTERTVQREWLRVKSLLILILENPYS